MKFLKGALLLLLLLIIPNKVKAVDLLYTTPCYTMTQVMVWSEEAQDSVLTRECTPSNIPLRDIMTVTLWRKLISPETQYTAYQILPRSPCLPDTLRNIPPGHYYLTARNLAGEACASNQVTIMPSDLTSVEITEYPILFKEETLFDLQGRKVKPPLPSGIYWKRNREGKVKKIVILK